MSWRPRSSCSSSRREARRRPRSAPTGTRTRWRRPGPGAGAREEDAALGRGAADRRLRCCARRPARRRLLHDRARIRGDGRRAHRVRRGDLDAKPTPDVVRAERVAGARGPGDRRAVGAVGEAAVGGAAHPLVRVRERRAAPRARRGRERRPFDGRPRDEWLAVFTGAVCAVTTAVGAGSAAPEPSAFVAVSSTRIVEPTSPGATTWVCAGLACDRSAACSDGVAALPREREPDRTASRSRSPERPSASRRRRQSRNGRWRRVGRRRRGARLGARAQHRGDGRQAGDSHPRSCGGPAIPAVGPSRSAGLGHDRLPFPLLDVLPDVHARVLRRPDRSRRFVRAAYDPTLGRSSWVFNGPAGRVSSRVHSRTCPGGAGGAKCRWSGCSALPRSSRPRTGTSAPRSTTRSVSRRSSRSA